MDKLTELKIIIAPDLFKGLNTALYYQGVKDGVLYALIGVVAIGVIALWSRKP